MRVPRIVVAAAATACVSSSAAFAGDVSLTSRFVTYGDGEEARIGVFNGNALGTPACDVQVTVYDATSTQISTQTVSVDPQRSEFVEQALPSPGPNPGSFRVDLDYKKSGGCSPKTLFGHVDVQGGDGKAANRYEVGFRKSKTVT